MTSKARTTLLLVVSTIVSAAVCRAETERITANLFVADSPAYPGAGKTVAGQTFVNNFLLTDFQTNATIATELGFCVAVETPGPAQCLYTLTFATGTVQISGLTYIPPVPPANPLSAGVFAITGGTGKYLGASGYYQQFDTTQNYGPGRAANGVTLEIKYPSAA